MSTAEKIPPTTKSSRLHREDWLEHALEVLRESGITGLRVEPLARSLGVTTGSFYWHFKDRQDLLHSVLDHWAENMAQAVETRTDTDDPQADLETLLTEITREDRNRYEIAVRNWATFDNYASDVVGRVDACRLKYCLSLFGRLGFSEEQANIRARMLIFYQIGEVGFSVKDSMEQRLANAALRTAILTTDCIE